MRALKRIGEPILTTTPVLTEAFHMLGPASTGSDRLRDFIEGGGVSVWFFERTALMRAFELMELRGSSVDLAAASLVAAADTLGKRQVFTLLEGLRYVPGASRASPSSDADLS